MTNSERMDQRIVRFLKKHHVMTLATAANGMPHCSNLFYAWLDEEQAFVFTSSLDTKHASDALASPQVAGSVVLESKAVGNLQGLQFTGRMFRPDDELHIEAKKRYLKRFPYAAVMDLELWILAPDWAKLTDNRLGFGKKLIWKKE